MKYSKVELPDFFKPDDDFIETAKGREREYKRMYKLLMDCADNITPTEAIAIIANIHVEYVALLIGTHVTEYDKQLLRGVLERSIASVVFVEK